MTLNTLEPLAMNSTSQFSKERAKVALQINVHNIIYLNDGRGRLWGAAPPTISARPARIAANLCGQRDCFAGSAPILKTDASRVVSGQKTVFGSRWRQAIRKDGACEAFPRRGPLPDVAIAVT